MISSCVSSLCAVIAFKECNFFRIIFDCPPGDLTPADFLVRRFPPVIPRRKDLESGGYVPWGKKSPNWAPFTLPLSWKARKTVRFGGVKNMPEYRPVCQNKADLHLSKSQPKALKSRWFWPYVLPHTGPVNPARMRIWGSFFPGMSEKVGFDQEYEEPVAEQQIIGVISSSGP